MENIKKRFNQSIELKKTILNDADLLTTIQTLSAEMTKAFKNKNRVFFCGNGGSAADAQHLAAELAGKFYFDRPPLPAEALHVNTSYLTAVANDYSYNEVFSRLIRAQANAGDILIGISTSGNSENVVSALKTANELGIITAGMTGAKKGTMQEICKYNINVPSEDTPRIQEAHILIGHIICERVEESLFGHES